jgi:hypothetical protein
MDKNRTILQLLKKGLKNKIRNKKGLECNFKNLRTNIKNELKFDNWKKT